ncbi:MAG: Uma2 family endonuclease [Rhodomicrobium sp.]
MTHFESRDERLSFATRAAEGLPRRRFTVAEIEAMVAAGILDEDEHIELIGGEVVPMAAKGNRHEVVKIALNRYCSKRISDDFILAQETTFRLSADTFLEPDFIFFGMQTKLKDLSAGNVHLAVEVADTSFSYDIGRKAALYASFGIVELWVIHAVRLETRIHRKPSLTGYQELIDLASDQALVPAFAPELAVTLCELELN